MNLTFVVICPTCGPIEVVEDIPDATWNEGVLWGWIAHQTHQAERHRQEAAA